MNLTQQHTLSIEPLVCDLYQQKKIMVSLVRSDQVHPQISGNKWYKLKHSLLSAKQKNVASVISFGGAYSNHIHALAYAAKALGIPSVGFIRGEWTEENATLKDAVKWGMQLKSLTRTQYREKTSPLFLAALAEQYPNSLIIPEGGSNTKALEGVNELMASLEEQLPVIDCLVAACGTGGTLAGLISGAQKTSRVLGIPVLKGGGFLMSDIRQLLLHSGKEANCQWMLDLHGHYGGYGKVNKEHLLAMLALEKKHSIDLEPIYTAKMLRRFNELVSEDYFEPDSKIALLHSGGLQGRRSFVDKYPDIFSNSH